MDNREIEKLMDRYKKEMLEFSKRNGEAVQPDEREKKQTDAENGRIPFMRDRSDPIEPKKEQTVKKEDESAVRMPDREPEASFLGSESSAPELIAGNISGDDVRRKLTAECERINSDSSASDSDRRRCEEITAFLASHKESGTLRIEAFAADRVYGIGSARVLVFLPLKSGNITVFDGLTNINGESETIRLPAPAKSLSLTPSTGGVLPYSVYGVYVEHPGYVRSAFGNVPVFSETESIQPVQMTVSAGDPSEAETVWSDESSHSSL